MSQNCQQKSLEGSFEDSCGYTFTFADWHKHYHLSKSVIKYQTPSKLLICNSKNKHGDVSGFIVNTGINPSYLLP